MAEITNELLDELRKEQLAAMEELFAPMREENEAAKEASFRRRGTVLWWQMTRPWTKRAGWRATLNGDRVGNVYHNSDGTWSAFLVGFQFNATFWQTESDAKQFVEDAVKVIKRFLDEQVKPPGVGSHA